MSNQKRARIDRTKYEEGKWIEEKDEIRNQVANFYNKLFSRDEFQFKGFPLNNYFPSIPDDAMNDIGAPIKLEEVKTAIFRMAPLKAPGLDSLHVVFFQNQWENVKDSVYKLISEIFMDPEKIRGINETNLVLIPKVDNPESFKQLRPISLCNVIYKVITKVIANRLRPCLSHLIAPNQCSFVPNRHSSDNIVITQAIIHSMKKKKGEKRMDGYKSGSREGI